MIKNECSTTNHLTKLAVLNPSFKNNADSSGRAVKLVHLDSN